MLGIVLGGLRNSRHASWLRLKTVACSVSETNTLLFPQGKLFGVFFYTNIYLELQNIHKYPLLSTFLQLTVPSNILADCIKTVLITKRHLIPRQVIGSLLFWLCCDWLSPCRSVCRVLYSSRLEQEVNVVVFLRSPLYAVSSVSGRKRTATPRLTIHQPVT